MIAYKIRIGVFAQMYWRLIDSLIAWYHKRGLGSYAWAMAATAIAMCLLFNLSLLAVIISIVGPVNILKTTAAASVTLPLAGSLLLVNLILSRSRSKHTRLKGDDDPKRKGSPGLALLYMAGSFLALLFAGIALVALKG
jgi:hypothetical protein